MRPILAIAYSRRDVLVTRRRSDHRKHPGGAAGIAAGIVYACSPWLAEGLAQYVVGQAEKVELPRLTFFSTVRHTIADLGIPGAIVGGSAAVATELSGQDRHREVPYVLAMRCYRSRRRQCRNWIWPARRSSQNSGRKMALWIICVEPV